MWYYSSDGQQQGPLDDVALDQLIANGVVNTDTFVWKEGMPEWTPLSQVRALGNTGTVVEDAGSSTCTMCGKNVGADNLIDLLGHRVCADCKPLAVQTLREGAPLAGKNNAAWRDGKKVVTYDQSSLPARCYKCNHAVAEPPMKRKLDWHPAAYYLLIFLNLFIYVIVAIFVRKRASVDVYLCAQHARRRKNFIIGGWSGAAVAIPLIIGAMAANNSWLMLVGIAVLSVAIIAGLAGASLIGATRIKGNTVWLRGAGSEFLASLPPWTQTGG
jgi:hypothetical protein